MRANLMRMSIATVLPLVAAACAPAEEEPQQAPRAPAPAVEAAAPAAEMPDTTADAVWAYLQEQEYDSWPLWPGTSALYAGNEPHGMLLTTYVNSIAMSAIDAGMPGEMADGAIVVKENYMPDSTLAAVTVMYKRVGYNPDHQDWWWLKRNADGSVDAEGKGVGCEGCHQGAASTGYLFTSSGG